jgi:hypothetical protein
MPETQEARRTTARPGKKAFATVKQQALVEAIAQFGLQAANVLEIVRMGGGGGLDLWVGLCAFVEVDVVERQVMIDKRPSRAPRTSLAADRESAGVHPSRAATG